MNIQQIKVGDKFTRETYLGSARPMVVTEIAGSKFFARPLKMVWPESRYFDTYPIAILDEPDYGEREEIWTLDRSGNPKPYPVTKNKYVFGVFGKATFSPYMD